MTAINSAALELIKSFEGCELTSYQDQIGVWTMGYGHTNDVEPGQTITQQQAEDLLQSDLKTYEQAVSDQLAVDVNPNQFGAMVSLAYNIGPGGYPTLLDLVNSKQWQAAADHFLQYCYAGGDVVYGLQRRREAERALFLQDLPS